MEDPEYTPEAIELGEYIDKEYIKFIEAGNENFTDFAYRIAQKLLDREQKEGGQPETAREMVMYRDGFADGLIHKEAEIKSVIEKLEIRRKTHAFFSVDWFKENLEQLLPKE